MEESAWGMAQSSKYAAMRDAIIKSKREVSASDTGQSVKDAVIKDAPTKL